MSHEQAVKDYVANHDGKKTPNDLKKEFYADCVEWMLEIRKEYGFGAIDAFLWKHCFPKFLIAAMVVGQLLPYKQHKMNQKYSFSKTALHHGTSHQYIVRYKKPNSTSFKLFVMVTK